MRKAISALALLVLLTGCSTVNAQTDKNDADVSDMSAVITEEQQSEAYVDPKADFPIDFKFVNASQYKGLCSVNFPDGSGNFKDENGEYCVKETYYFTERDVMCLGFAYLRDMESGSIKRMYSPALRMTADRWFNDYEVTSASMSLSSSDSLKMNCFSLKGSIKVTGTVIDKDTNPHGPFNVLGDRVILSLSSTGGLPAANLDSSTGNEFLAVFSEECKNYPELVKAIETGGEITITADEVSVSYEPGMSMSANLLTFENFTVN